MSAITMQALMSDANSPQFQAAMDELSELAAFVINYDVKEDDE